MKNPNTEPSEVPPAVGNQSVWVGKLNFLSQQLPNNFIIINTIIIVVKGSTWSPWRDIAV